MNKKILVVDDEIAITAMIEELIESDRPGYEVVVKNTRKEAIACIPLIAADTKVAILDGVLDSGHGWEVAEVLKANNPDVLIFLFSSHNFNDAVPQEKQHLYAGCLPKPVELNRILAVIPQ